MEPNYKYQKIPTSRIATIDILSIGLKKHHVCALLEFDVTTGRQKLRELKKSGPRVSFNAWILKLIGVTLEKHKEAAAFLFNKHKLVAFDDINISMLVEKEIHDKKVPIPLVIEKANEKSVSEIAIEIENARNQVLTEKEIVLHSKTNAYESLYYKLPGFVRRLFWRALLGHPKIAYQKMGNVAVTSLGMMGQINGWFIPISVHPISFGIGSVVKKAVVIKDEIKIREILNMTILLDHDVIDGAPMVRFIKDLTNRIENGEEL